jgi:hypothetical protein
LLLSLPGLAGVGDPHQRSVRRLIESAYLAIPPRTTRRSASLARRQRPTSTGGEGHRRMPDPEQRGNIPRPKLGVNARRGEAGAPPRGRGRPPGPPPVAWWPETIHKRRRSPRALSAWGQSAPACGPARVPLPRGSITHVRLADAAQLCVVTAPPVGGRKGRCGPPAAFRPLHAAAKRRRRGGKRRRRVPFPDRTRRPRGRSLGGLPQPHPRRGEDQREDGSGTSQMTPSGGRVISAEKAWLCQGSGSASTPPRLPVSVPP